MSLFSPTASPQMRTDPSLGDLGVRIVAGVENLLLNMRLFSRDQHYAALFKAEGWARVTGNSLRSA